MTLAPLPSSTRSPPISILTHTPSFFLDAILRNRHSPNPSSPIRCLHFRLDSPTPAGATSVEGSGQGGRGSLWVVGGGKTWLLGEGTGDQASMGASGMGGEDRNRDANEERGIGWHWEMCHTLAGTLAPIRAGGGPPPHLAQRMRCTRGCYPHFSGCSPSEGPC